jgi:predicted RNase H-like nuclease
MCSPWLEGTRVTAPKHDVDGRARTGRQSLSQLLAIGADGARGGWLAALGYGEPDRRIERIELRLEPTFEQLAALRIDPDDDAVAVCVDIPMGLPDTVDLRPCDKQARALLGARANSVFAPPSRPLLAAATYADARKLVAAAQREDSAVKGLSAQAFGIAPKMREADEYLHANPGAQTWLYECHPELSFRALAEGKVLRDKKSVGGQAERLQLLLGRFPGVLGALVAFEAGSRVAETADALDALVALDSALHVRAGDYEELGGETDSAGLAMRMVF